MREELGVGEGELYVREAELCSREAELCVGEAKFFLYIDNNRHGTGNMPKSRPSRIRKK